MGQADRFWSKVRKTKACWLWTASVNSCGYGTRWFLGKVRSAHHVSWFLAHGDWPTENLMHSCDTPACVNPAHLSEGDQFANMADMAVKGRSCHRMSEEQARAALARVRAGGESYRTIGRSYGVRPETIYHLANGKTWKHLH